MSKNRYLFITLLFFFITSFRLFAQAPVFTDAKWEDSDDDGNIDQVLLTFNANVDVTDAAAAADGLDCIIIDNDGTTITLDNYDYSGELIVLSFTVYFTLDPITGTGISNLTVTYDDTPANHAINENGGGALEMANGEAPSADEYTDGAKPVLLQVNTLIDQVGDNVTVAGLNAIEFIYSEAMVVSADGNDALAAEDIGYDGSDPAAETGTSTNVLGNLDDNGSIQAFGDFATTGFLTQSTATWNTIKTSSDAKTITIYFNDDPAAYFTDNTIFDGNFTAEGSVYILGQTPSDAANTDREVNTSYGPTEDFTNSWDVIIPTVSEIWTLDIDDDGKIDGVDIQFGESILDASLSGNPLWIEIDNTDCEAFSTSAFGIDNPDQVTEDTDANDENVRLRIITDVNEINGTDLKVIDYDGGSSGRIRDIAGNLLLEVDDIGTTKTDAARPVINSAVANPNNIQITVTLSENVST
ncbi:MAG: hypothetical protein KAX05_08165, partial [Bacteroidales bacterium]|nr:hypothetical protein [Bacteroidales bacterium]